MIFEQLHLKDLCLKITKGTTPTTIGGKFSDEGINFIKSESLNYDGSIDATKFVKIDEKTHELLKRSQIEENDLLYSIAGVNLGKCGQVKAEYLPANTNQAVAIIRIDPRKAIPKYIEYYLRNPSFVLAVNSSVAQSAQPNVNLTEIGNFELNLPDIDAQKKVTALLSAIDKKIELNQRMNETLEAMAQAIFKSWFVDFDPVKAKAEGRTPEGMDAATAALFPSRLTDTGLPEGWELKKLGELSKVAIGRTPPRKEQEWFSENPSDKKWVSIRDLGNAGVFISKVSEYLTDDAIKKFNVPMIKAGTVVLSFKLTVGRVAIASEDMYSNEAIAQFGLQGSVINSDYLYFWLKNFDYNSLGSTSSIATAVNSSMLKDIPVLVPTHEVLRKFTSQVEKVLLRIRTLQEENTTLEDIRDCLLPRLISGKIKVSSSGDTI